MSDGSFTVGGGQFVPPAATPLGTGLNTTLGLQGPRMPGLKADMGDVVPTLLVGDTSDRLSRALIEARGFAAGRITPGGDRFKLRMQARSGGGTVIESLALVPDGSTNFETTVRFGSQPTFTAAPQLQQIAVGGRDLRNVCHAGQGNAQVISPLAVIANNLLNDELEDVRWYIRPGEWLFIQGSNSQAVNYAILWRELDE